MKTRKGYTLRSLGKEFILVADGFEAVDFSRMISLNETAAFLWKEVEDKDFDADMLTTLLTDNYDIDRETAQNDVTAMLKSWAEAGIIED
jgi:hypothetical protein